MRDAALVHVPDAVDDLVPDLEGLALVLRAAVDDARHLVDEVARLAVLEHQRVDARLVRDGIEHCEHVWVPEPLEASPLVGRLLLVHLLPVVRGEPLHGHRVALLIGGEPHSGEAALPDLLDQGVRAHLRAHHGLGHPGGTLTSGALLGRLGRGRRLETENLAATGP